MKKVVILLTAAVILLAACGSEDADKLTVTPLEILEHIEESSGLPIMLDIEQRRLPDYKVNPDDAVSFVAKEAAISAVFVQLIIIEAKDGRVGDVHTAMLEHQSSLRDAVFYPQGQEAAANSRVGARGNLVYLICDVNAQEIEEILLQFAA